VNRTSIDSDGAPHRPEPSDGGLRRRLLRGAGGTLALKVAEAGATFLLNVILARLLGAAGLGVYAFALAWANLLIIPALLGSENLSVRFIAAYEARGALDLVHGFMRWAFRTVGLVAIVVSVAAAGIAWLLSPRVDARLVAFWLAMAFVPVMALARLSQAMVRGFRRIAAGFLPELAVLPAATFLLIGLVLLLPGVSMTSTVAVGIQLAAGVIALAAGLLLLARTTPAALLRRAPAYETRAWFTAALPLLFIGGTQVVNRQTDVIMLGLLVGDAAAGTYVVAARSAALIGFVLFSANAAMAPMISRVYHSGDMGRLQRIATLSARLTMLFSVPVAIGFIVFGDWFLRLFGAEFAVARPALTILSIGQFINASMGSVALLLTMTGHERLAARGFGIAAVANVSLNAALIPAFGATGAAIATATSLLVWNMVLAVYVYRRLGLHSTALGVIGRRPMSR